MPISKSQKKRPLLVADDGDPGQSKRSRALQQIAERLSKRLEVPVDLLKVGSLTFMPVDYPFPEARVEEFMDAESKLLAARAKKFRVPTRPVFKWGQAITEILSLANQPSAYEMVIVGTHGRKGVTRLLLGSVAEEIVRNSKIPVLTIGPRVQEDAARASSTGDLLLATDLGPNSRRAEAYARDLARQLGVGVTLLHCFFEGIHPVLRSAGATSRVATAEMKSLFSEQVSKAMQDLQRKQKRFERDGTECRILLDERSTDSSSAVLSAAKKIAPSMIVLGTHGRNIVSGAFFGSTVRDVILDSSVPVLTVKSIRG